MYPMNYKGEEYTKHKLYMKLCKYNYARNHTGKD